LAYPSHTISNLHPAAESQPPIRVLLAISSRLERLGWSIVVQNQNDLQLIGEFGALDAAFAFLLAHRADVVLIDEALLTPKYCKRLHRESTRLGCRFLLVANHPVDEGLGRSLYSFASDCLLKGLSASDMLAAIRG
jgi:DNA-binding NarL/FixJ family response regulator